MRGRLQQARETGVHLARDEEKEVGRDGREGTEGGRRVDTDCKVTEEEVAGRGHR